MAGKVYLVGAGPGDPGLLTLKGKAALEKADCVIYDFLAATSLLRYARPDAEKIFAGKRGGGPRCPQDEITDLLLSKARAGMTLVRLKGGDPFIFGRGGEEAEALVAAGIPFEIVPGVTSGIGAPAYAGIPLTHRNFGASVCFIAGYGHLSDDDPGVDWNGVASSSSTLVFYMGTRNLAVIAQKLIAHGRSVSTPAAVIRWGTRAAQQVVTGTLEDIAERAAKVEPPTLIVVGDVVTLRERLNWFEKLPLFGKRIAVTRTREQSSEMIAALEELGAETTAIPTIEIRPPDSWQPLDDAIRRLEEFQFLLVTSANGVRQFLARLSAGGSDTRRLRGLTIGAIGPATAAEFAKSGIKLDFVPREYRAEGLLEALKDYEVNGKAILIPRAKVARDLVPRTLTEHGARVEVVEAYQTVVPSVPAEQLREMFAPPFDAVTFTSSSTASNLAKMLGGEMKELLAGSTIASIGPVTSETLRRLGLEVTVEASESTIPGLVRELAEFYKRKS